jgi:hypothetical protein
MATQKIKHAGHVDRGQHDDGDNHGLIAAATMLVH